MTLAHAADLHFWSEEANGGSAPAFTAVRLRHREDRERKASVGILGFTTQM